MQSSNGNHPVFRRSSIAGIAATRILEPDTDVGVGEILAEAAGARESVAPVGGGTHLGIGNAPARLDVILSLRGLNRILAHEPADMTLSVEAGATLASVQEALSAHGQALPIEVADPSRATIGGILASALYSPKRLGWGTLRDYLIGIRVAYPDGTVASAGGMVVKNVSGFDLMRMHHGALGTLGVIVSANFKVLPAPRSERTVIVGDIPLEDLVAIRNTVMAGRARPAAFEVTTQNGSASVAIRIDGRERTSAMLASELAGALGRHASILDPDASRKHWTGYVASFDSSDQPEQWWIRSRTTPSQALDVLRRIAGLPQIQASDSVTLSASPGLGYVDVRGPSSMDRRAFGETLKAMRMISARSSVVALPAELRNGIDVWGESVDALDLMRSLKQEYDPHRVLNPGRFVGGL